MAEFHAVNAAGRFEFERLAGCLGAVVRGADLRSLDDEDARVLRMALARHRVLAFPAAALNDDEHLRFASVFGPPTLAHPTMAGSPHDARVLPLDSATGIRADRWHTDITFVRRPVSASVLRAEAVPAVGGDTVWADLAAALGRLSEPVRAMVRLLRARHDNCFDYEGPFGSFVEAVRVDRRRGMFVTEHPVVRVHPATGEEVLFVNPGFTRAIVGLRPVESRRVLDLLFDTATVPENTVRWRWSAGDVVVWDNVATMHYGIDDYGDAERVMYRVTVRGPVPVGPDGRESSAVDGDPEWDSTPS